MSAEAKPFPETRKGSITADRRETKYIFLFKEASRLRKLAEENLPCHTYTAGRFITFITTLYLDTEDRSFFRQAESSPLEHIKLRAREYYYFNEELIEHAASYETLFVYSPDIWLEIKERKFESTFKHRLRVPKRLLIRMLAGADCKQEVLSVNSEDPDAQTVFDLLQGYLQRRNGPPIFPSCLVHYRRRAFQNADETFRMTLDSGLSFHAAEPDLLVAQRPLIRENLGPSLYSPSWVLLEVKSTGRLPDWLMSALEQNKPVDFSKFRESSKLASEHCKSHEP